MTITRDELTITHGTSKWGGPLITVVANEALFDWTERYPGRDPNREPRMVTFKLQSTEGLNKLDGIRSERGDGYHVHEEDSSGGRGEWLGVFYDSPDEVIGSFVGYLNARRDRDLADKAVSLSSLHEALTNFEESLRRHTRRDFAAEWETFKGAVVAVDVALNSRGES